MRTLSTLLLLTLSLQAVAAAQTWRRQYPPAGRDLYDVEMQNALEGWAVGSDGVMLRTTNGGIAWSEFGAGPGALRAVQFVGSTGFAAGEGIFKSSDGGQTWSSVHFVTGVQDLHALDAQRVWAVTQDARVVRTSNGGANWAAVQLAGATGGARSIRFRNQVQGWVCGDLGLFQRTLDGGQTWQSISLGTAADLYDLHFATAQLGWVLAGDRLHRTVDGGLTWSQQMLPAGAFAHRLSWLGTSYGLVAGPDGQTWRTANGGVTWMPGGAIGSGDVADVAMGDLTYGLAVGSEERIWSTTDGGSSWSLVHGGAVTPAEVVYDITSLDTQRAWASCSSGVILKTEDGGETWTPNPTDNATQWHAVDFFDELNGFAVGRRQGFYPMRAWTANGGASWTILQGLGMYDFNDVDAVTADIAVACADTYIHRSENHGVTWSLIPTTPQSSYHGAHFIDSQTGWVVGGAIFTTGDGGASWNFLYDPAVTLYDVSFVDASRGWAVGASGTVLRTNDGGFTWVAQDAGAGTTHLYNVEAVSGAVAWVVGASGFVARTTDGGATWQTLPPSLSPGTSVYAARFVSADEGWIGGGFENGLWRRTAGVGGSCAASSYCVSKTNSLGLQARLHAQGNPSATLGTFGVRVEDGMPNQPGILIFSNLAAASLPIVGGTLCVQPPFDRLPPQVLDPAGRTTYAIGVPPTVVGTSRWFQFWYRDPLHPDGTGIALTDGLEVRFCE